jgi:membrane-bound lytic murein transglycosylase B
MTQRLPLNQWHELGVRRLDGNVLPKVTIDASLVEAESNTFLVYGNYDTLLSYNCAHYYALSVGLLADQLN